MARKIRTRICGIICFLGFMVMLGAAGSSDLNLISYPELIKQCAIGMAMFVGGGYLGGFIE